MEIELKNYPETENHIFMVNATQLLTRAPRSIPIDDATRGWWLGYGGDFDGENMHQGWLQRPLARDFNEFNSNPYQKFPFASVLNIYDFVGYREGALKKGAQILLDYYSARFATQSSNLRRVVPFHRRLDSGRAAEDIDLWEADTMSSMYAVLAGNYNNDVNGFAGTSADFFHERWMMFPATTGYQVPDLILDLMIEKQDNAYYVRVKQAHLDTWDSLDWDYTPPATVTWKKWGGHYQKPSRNSAMRYTAELIYSEENFMISAGGVYNSYANFRDHSNDVAVRPTVLIPTRNSHTRLDQFVRFKGDHDADGSTRLNNTGVFENFACGAGEVIVPFLLSACLYDEVEGTNRRWRFYDFSETSSCGVDYGMYLTVHETGDGGSDYDEGFFEAVDSREFVTIDDFIAKIEDGNGPLVSYDWSPTTSYLTSRGRVIGCDPHTDRSLWPIKWYGSPGSVHFLSDEERRFKNWSFIESHTMSREFETVDGAYVLVTRPEDNYVLKADGTGQVLVNNPKRDESLILSMADPRHTKDEGPIRILQSCQATDLIPADSVDTVIIQDQLVAWGETSRQWFFSENELSYVSLLFNDCNDISNLTIEGWSPGSGTWVPVETRIAPDEYMSPHHRWRVDVTLNSYSHGSYRGIMVSYHSSSDVDDMCVLQDVDAFRRCPHDDPMFGTGDCNGNGVRDDIELCLEEEDDGELEGAPDSDGDGVPDGLNYINDFVGYETLCDICPAKPNPSQTEVMELGLAGGDIDGDGIPNSCDLCRYKLGPFIGSLDMSTIDMDGDDVADTCDNCLDESNYDQKNCDFRHDPYPHLPAPHGQYSSTDSGDVCDPDPCVRLETVQEPQRYCTTYIHDLLFVNALVDPDYIGFDPSDEFAEYSPRLESVDHAFCNCTGSDPATCMFDCNVSNPWEQFTADSSYSGTGWHYMNLYEPMTGTRSEVDRTFRKNGMLYSSSGTPTGPPPRQRFLWEMLDEHEYEKNCSATSCPEFNAYLYFAPLQSGHVPFYETYYPDNPSLITPPWTVTPKQCFMLLDPWAAEAEDARRGSGMGVHFEDGLIGAWPGDYTSPIELLIPTWEWTDPLPPEHEYQTTRPSSLVMASATLAYNPESGAFVDEYKHSFQSPEDILDASLGAAVMVRRQALQVDDLPSPGETVTTIWVFGGVDRESYRSDLWFAMVDIDGSGSGDKQIAWSRLTPSYDEPWPAPRAGSALFASSTMNKLVMWGGHDGEVLYDDLWHFDLTSLTWEEVSPEGWAPPGLVGFAFNHSMERTGADPDLLDQEEVGFIWGGYDESGAIRNELYILELATGTFRTVLAGTQGPPGLLGAGLEHDSMQNVLYLFGGYDSDNVHNWLWSYDLEQGRWLQLEDDCIQGTCPYYSYSPVVLVGDASSRVSVIPGRSAHDNLDRYAEPAFIHERNGGWTGTYDLHRPGSAGDCDSDGATDDLFGTLCTNHESWWNEPGQHRCDTIAKQLVCDQPLPQAVEIKQKTISGLRAIELIGSTMFVLKGDRMLSVDVGDPSQPLVLDNIYLGGTARDIEVISPDTLVAAADSGLVFIDATEPSSLVLTGETSTCGRAVSVEADDEHLYFMTPLGIGRASIDGGLVPEVFAFVLPSGMDSWAITPVPVEDCTAMSYISELACAMFSCPGDGYRPMEIFEGRAIFRTLRNLMVVDLRPDIPTLDFTYHTPFTITELRIEGVHLYVNFESAAGRIADISTPESPILLGVHDVEQWVYGIFLDNETRYRINGDRIEAAVPVN